jgi:putative flavoprotein involved in K+ transport
VYGVHPGFSWIDLPVPWEHELLHRRGIVAREPGLYFIRLHFLYENSSSMIHGVDRDAALVAQANTSRSL